MRAGRYVRQPQGYRAFIPASLPPDPPVRMEDKVTRLLSDADRALGRLDGIGTILPNPDLFVAMYVRHEAVLSSQIEGTQSTLQDILAFEVDPKGRGSPHDVTEVVNYVAAMNEGLARLKDLPLSLRLIREVHARLLRGVRGEERTPGEFRRSQNWIGPAGCSLSDAYFVPPPAHEMHEALSNLEKFLHDREGLPPLIQCGLAHAQFETIHPFLDGNGRVGRLLITILLCERQILARPLLYLSYYLKANRVQYYDRLTAVRTDGDWEGWLRFFLQGVLEVSESATVTGRAILKLRESHREQLRGAAREQRLLDYLFQRPVISVRLAEQYLDCSYHTADKALVRLEREGILQETTGQERYRLYRYEPYLALFDRQILELPSHDESSETEIDGSNT